MSVAPFDVVSTQPWADEYAIFSLLSRRGATFIAVFYTQVRDLYGESEDIWEGVFALVASIMIWVMALGFLRMDRAKLKWKIKLEKAFVKQQDKLQSKLAMNFPPLGPLRTMVQPRLRFTTSLRLSQLPLKEKA